MQLSGGVIFLFWRVCIVIPHSSYSDSYESLDVLMSLMASHILNKSQAWTTLTTHSQTSRYIPIHGPPYLLSSRVIFLPHCGFHQLLPQAILKTVWIPLLTQSECSLLPNYPTRLPRWIKTCSRTAPCHAQNSLTKLFMVAWLGGVSLSGLPSG